MTVNQSGKDTIYVDVDDEITTIIDKVRGGDERIAALVLPKRATVLQSIVNMKLLKRAADAEKKHVVLITSEAGLLPLAGAVGLHVAKNLQSKPVIPAGPDGGQLPDTLDDEDEETGDDPDIDNEKSVGELATSATTKKAATPLASDEEAIELDDLPEEDAAVLPDPTAKPGKKGGKKFKIPNFERFRLLILLGSVGLVLLLVGSYFAFFVMPKAKITIKTDSTTVNSNIAFTASTTATEFDAAGKVLPAKRQELKKTDAQKIPASGQKDVGTKATGNATLSIPCSAVSGAPPEVPAGTGISSSNLTFITQKAVSLTNPDFGDGCNFTATTAVTAQNNGDQYNLGARDYAVAGFGTVKAKGTDMTGGTSKIVKIVSQADVDTAKQKLTTSNSQAATDELKKTLQAVAMFPLTETLTTADPVVTTTPNVGDEATEVSVTSTITYTMLGVNEDNLKTMVEDEAKKQIDQTKQAILDNGLKDASFVVQQDVAKKAPAQTKATVQSLVKAGPKLDTEGIKREVAGKKKGQVSELIQSRPGIKDVTVEYSPFWVSKTPTKLSKITIVFDQAEDAKNNKP